MKETARLCDEGRSDRDPELGTLGSRCGWSRVGDQFKLEDMTGGDSLGALAGIEAVEDQKLSG